MRLPVCTPSSLFLPLWPTVVCEERERGMVTAVQCVYIQHIIYIYMPAGCTQRVTERSNDTS